MDHRKQNKYVKLLRDTGQIKQHYKMYKSSKGWLFAAISLLTFGVVATINQTSVQASDTITDGSSNSVATSTSSDDTGNQVALKTSSSTVSAVSDQSATSTDSQSASSSANPISSSASTENQSTTSSAASQTSTADNTTSTANKISARSAVVASADADETASDTKTVDPVNTGSLDGTNPAGSDAATSNLTAADIPDSFETTGSAVTTGTPGTVTLTNGEGQNGSYVFDNQVDTSKPFTLTGSYLSTAYKGTGGGLGIIIQPVDPQDAGKNSNTTADVGIDGLKNTTFVGRDFYVDKSKNDTDWNNLTIRQTDASGNMVLTPLANITGGANQTAAVTKGEYYVLTWTPTSVDATTGTVTGTLNYTSYLDAAHTISVQTTGNIVTTLSRAVSLAAFGATGGTAGTQTATVTAFTGTRVTMPVTVHYVDQNKNPISTDNKITVNVGSTFGVGANTDTENNTDTSGTYQAKKIDGYTFNSATGPVTVINTNISTGSNDITVTYSVAQQTVNYTVPTGTTAIPSATQSAVPGTTDPTVHEYAAVQITQIPGYTSWVSKNGAAAVAQTTIPAEASGSDDETYNVTYVAHQTSISVNYVDYFGNTIGLSTEFTGNYGDVDNLTTNATTAVAIDGYMLSTPSVTDVVNASAIKVSFTLDADGNVIATDANGVPVTSITLTYKINVKASVSGTKVYDGLDDDGDDTDASDEPDDYKNLTWVLTDSNGELLASNIDGTGVVTSIYYLSPNVGIYSAADGQGITISGRDLGSLNKLNPQYHFPTNISGDYTITTAPITATISSDSKVYDGSKTVTAPTVTYTGVSGEMVPPVISWDNSDFEYVGADKIAVATPVKAGTYTVQLSAAGLAKLATAQKSGGGASNYAVTPITGTYTITAADATATLSTPSFTYTGINASAETGLFVTVAVHAGEGDDGGSTVKVALTSDDVTFSTDGKNVGTYDYQLTATGLAAVKAAVGNYNLTNIKDGSVTLTIANALIEVTSQDFTYDGNQHSLSVTIIGEVNDEALDYSVSNQFETDAGTYPVNVTLTAGSTINSNYNIMITDGTMKINSLATTVTLSGNETETYTGKQQTPKANNYKVSLPAGVTYTLQDSDIQLASGGTDKGTYDVVLSAAGEKNINAAVGTNYTVTFGTPTATTFTISPAAETVGLTNAGKTYDGTIAAAPTINTSVAVTLTADDYTTTSVSGTSNFKDADDYTVTLTKTGIEKITAANNNYTLNDLSKLTATYTITKAPATITVTGGSFIYDGQLHSPTASVSEIATGEKLSYDLTTGLTDVGEEDVTATFDDNDSVNRNYDISVNTVKLAVTQAAVSSSAIRIEDGNKTYDGDPITAYSHVYITVNGVETVLNWSTDITSTDFVYTPIMGSTDLTGVGTYAITLSAAGISKMQAVNGNYDLSSLSTAPAGTYTIAPATAAIQINAAGKTYDGTVIAAPTVSITGIKDGKIEAPTAITLTADDYTTVNQTGTDDLVGAGNYKIKLTDAGVTAI